MSDAPAIYVIAEAGVNHNGDLGLARRLVDAAADAGADAVKFQTFRAERLASPLAPKAAYQQRSTDAQESQLAMLRRLELPYAWHAELRARAQARGLEFLSTPFDLESLQFLVDLGVPRLKVPSGELTNGPLLWQFARTGLPLIVSTGMATLAEVETALAVIAHGRTQVQEPACIEAVWQQAGSPVAQAAVRCAISLLHCTSQYPTPPQEVNLRAIDTLAQAFGLPVGYSDHTAGSAVAIAAVARGARLIEKHFTLDRALPGPDHAASLEPAELAALVRDVRAVALALGDGCKRPQASEWDTRRAARQRVVLSRPVRAGAILQRADLTTARTGVGRLPNELWGCCGQSAQADLQAGEVLP
jgi:N-acetylneuraminate synthase